MPGYAPPWTPEQISTLRREWNRGTSGPRIAAKLGKTLQAVMAKRVKMGLPKRPALVYVGSVYVTDPVYVALLEAADEQHIPICAMVRSALVEWMEKRESDDGVE